MKPNNSRFWVRLAALSLIISSACRPAAPLTPTPTAAPTTPTPASTPITYSGSNPP
jgi:hypothetical protein